MRIVAGKYKRQNLIAPNGTDITRPTSDRARESLFNILMPHTHGARALDLFAGSGALGLECLSRGAQLVVFVESHPEALRCLKKNLETLRVPPQNYFIANCAVESFLNSAVRRSIPGWREADFAASMDLIFADPPYALTWYNEAMNHLESSGLCAQECLAVVEMSSRQPSAIAQTPPWELFDHRVYGAARLEFWRRNHREISHEHSSPP